MGEIIRNRTIRPSTRLESSKNYKIDTKKVSSNDTLIVNINHESKPFQQTYTFNGKDVASKNSISFKVTEFNGNIQIKWYGAKPINQKTTTKNINTSITKTKKETSENNSHKKSFEPIYNSNTKILILGTLPGDRSIKDNQYYSHPGNKFWKVIAKITNNPEPFEYSEKKKLLLKENIGIWDVANKGKRKGSLDNNITEIIPNEIDKFITSNPNIKVIAFNGKKAENLYDKYFYRNPKIKYISLPSTSPANTHFNLDNLVSIWKKILI